MNEIILIGEVLSNITYSKNSNISTIYLKVYNNDSNNCNYIPVNFKSINYNNIKFLKGRRIAISGHIEMMNNPVIFVDVLNY